MAILGCHPRIAFPEVAWYYPRFRPYLHTYGDLGVDENFRTLASEMIHGLKTPYFGVETNPLTIVDEVIDSLREKSFAGIYCAMLDRYARSVDKPRWGEKTPYNMFFVKEIIEDFPNAQFIFITRDGRDSIAEYMQSAFGSTNAFCGAELWLLGQNAVKPWRERLDSTQWLDVQYETLVRNPEAVLKEICSFLDEKYHPAMLNFHQSKSLRNAASRVITHLSGIPSATSLSASTRSSSVSVIRNCSPRWPGTNCGRPAMKSTPNRSKSPIRTQRSCASWMAVIEPRYWMDRKVISSMKVTTIGLLTSRKSEKKRVFGTVPMRQAASRSAIPKRR